MRRRLEALGAPVPRFAAVTDVADVDAFAARVDAPIVVKTVRGGYDGRGVTLARDLGEARDVAGRYLADGAAVLVEEKVALRRELAALVARSPFGQGAAWPVVQTVQLDGICVEVIAPAPGLDCRTRQRRSSVGASARSGTGRGRGAGRRVVRDRRRRADGQRARDAAAQFRPLDHGRLANQPVRTTPACGAGLPARRHHADRAGVGDGQCAWRTTDSGDEHGRAAASPLRPDAGRQGPPVRQGRAARPKDRARQHPRRRRRLARRRRVRRRCPGTRGPGRTLVVARRMDRRMERTCAKRRSAGSRGSA